MKKATLLVILPIFASAQTPRTTLEESPSVVVTARRSPTDAAQITEWVSTVDQEKIADRAPQVMSEALRGQPGAFFQQTAPGQGITIIRGLKGSEVLHLVDGMRLNNAFFRTAPSQYIALLDPLNAESIELLRGSRASAYGSDAMGGVVQVLTPEQRFEGADWQLRGRTQLGYQSGDVGHQGRVALALGQESLSLALGASRLSYGNRDVAGSGQAADGAGNVSLQDRVGPAGYQARGWDGKVLWQPRDNHELMLSTQYFSLPELPRYNEVVPGFGTASEGLPEAAISIYDNSRTFTHFRYRIQELHPWAQELVFNLAHQKVTDNRFDRSLDLVTDSFERNRSSLYGVTLQASAAPTRAISINYGVDWYVDRVDSSKFEVEEGVTTFNGADVGVKSRFPDGARSDAIGVFIIAAWNELAPWRVETSIRGDRVDIDLPQADRRSSGEFSESALSGGIGIGYDFTPQLSWNSNLRRGFRAPNVNDLAQIGRRSNSRIVIASPDLQAETLWSVDTGVRFNAAQWSIETALYHSWYRDRITLVNTGVLYPDGEAGCNQEAGCFEAQSRNAARAKYYGVETEAQWQDGPLQLSAVLNYTFGEQELEGTVTPANRIPPLNGSLAAAWQFTPAYSAELRFWFADRQDRLDPSDLSDNRINPNGTPGYTSVDLSTRLALLQNLNLRLSGRNLLDRDYREHGSGIDAAGRNWLISADYRFGAD
jgi:outer membrane receptor protein involved in Fe transport